LKFATFTQSLLSPHPDFFGEAWSLAVEEIFYFITPLVISIFLLLTKNKKFSILVSIAIMLIIPFLLRANAALNTNMTFNEIRATALFRVDSIMIGVIFSWAYLKNRISNQVKFGTLLIPIAIYISSKPDSYMDQSEFLKIFLFSMANIGFACLIVSGYKIRINKKTQDVTTRLARWSYAAYLTNLPVLLTIRYLLPPPTTLLNCLFQWALFISITIFSAFIVYITFERNVLKLRDSIIKK